MKPIPVPGHLKPYLVEQDASLYTAIDHAAWRYILRISRDFFKGTAHENYLEGLEKTGITTEHIPLLSEMNQRLRKYGWTVVAVSDFIPPAIFMELQSLRILPVCCEMRKLENLSYTPTPDIVHEAAGHAPFLADKSYSDYLAKYGQVSRYAISSDKDYDVYEGIRYLSEVKENPQSTPENIRDAQDKLNVAISRLDYVSEANYLARMNWWTVEYGMVGDLSRPLIYGAGLLSSVGESLSCIQPSTLKIPFSLDCINLSYDITRPQPQLFVTPTFKELSEAIETFADTMAFRRGGVEGLAKAKLSRTLTTSVLDTGVQISGILSEFLLDPQGHPSYLQLKGPCQLSLNDKQLEGHGPEYHAQGYGCPVGPLKGISRALQDLTSKDFEKLGFKSGQKGKLVYKSGVEVEGILFKKVQKKGKTLLLSFKDCTVRLKNQILFQPDWGIFDLSVGLKVVSVFGGAADRVQYAIDTHQIGEKKARPPKSNLTLENKKLDGLYQQVRALREGKKFSNKEWEILQKVHEELERIDRKDWLLRLEMIELEELCSIELPWKSQLMARLFEISRTSKEKKSLIERGLALCQKEPKKTSAQDGFKWAAV